MEDYELFLGNGETIINPSLEFLKDHVFNGTEEFWRGDSGTASIRLRSEVAFLSLVFKDGMGFEIVHGGIANSDTRFVALGGQDFETQVQVYVGGNRTWIPLALSISREVAWAVIEEFCKTGKKATKVPWKRTREIDWVEE